MLLKEFINLLIWKKLFIIFITYYNFYIYNK